MREFNDPMELEALWRGMCAAGYQQASDTVRELPDGTKTTAFVAFKNGEDYKCFHRGEGFGLWSEAVYTFDESGSCQANPVMRPLSFTFEMLLAYYDMLARNGHKEVENGNSDRC